MAEEAEWIGLGKLDGTMDGQTFGVYPVVEVAKTVYPRRIVTG
jgi:hypothetical protein